MKYTSTSENQTQKIAEKIAKKFKGGEVLCLVGDLGAGKTVFAKGVAKALGIKSVIISPTFVLMKVYPLTKNEKVFSRAEKLVHIDAYRLNHGDDLEAIGVKDYLGNPECVVIIEWADRVRDIWPKDATVIDFKVKGEKREIEIH